MRNKEDEPYNCLTLLPWETRIEPEKFPEMRKMDVNVLGEQSNYSFYSRILKTRELQRQNSRDLQRAHFEFPAEYRISTYCVKKLNEPEEEVPERIKYGPWCSCRADPSSQVRKAHNSGVFIKILKNILPQ